VRDRSGAHLTHGNSRSAINVLESDEINERISPVDKLVVTSTGSVAWIANGSDAEGDPNPPPLAPTEVHVLGRDDDHQIVARDPSITEDSLRLLPGGHGVSWQSDDGQTYTSPLK